VVKALEALLNINISYSRRTIATIYTDRKFDLKSVKNYRYHKILIEKNQTEAPELEKEG
jgi:hypothetical protein